MITAYQLRAPGQKGIHVSAWGSFLGQLLLRSMDRASTLYDSMCLRGFYGEFYYANEKSAAGFSVAVGLACACLVLVFRRFNLPAMLATSVLG